jgi:anti-anti-sigma factor
VARFEESAGADGRCVVRAAGDIDLAVVVEFQDAVRSSLERFDAVELDLGNVTFIDSSGLGSLVLMRKEAAAMGKSLTLANLSRATSRLLEVTGLSGAFAITDPQL